MPLRSPRIEALLGGQITEASHESVAQLVGNPNAAESDDLDYKIKYDPGATAREELAKDIAAFANASGGLLIVGMADDKKTALPTHAVQTSIEDRTLRWIRETAATNIAPLPEFDVTPVPSPTDPTLGFILISVPRSPAAPHAVFDPSARRALAYPRRHGRTTTWLPESGVATSYRERFAGLRARDARIDSVESDLLDAFWEADQWEPILAVSMVPERPGAYPITSGTLTDFHRSAITEKFFGFDRVNFESRSVGADKLQVRSSLQPVDLHAELHADGSCAWGSIPWTVRSDEECGAVHIDDVTLTILNALRFLAKNSSIRSNTSGTALFRASLLSSYVEHKDFVTHRPLPLPGSETTEGPIYEYLLLGDFTSSRSYREMGTRRLGSASGNIVGIIDDVAKGGAGLASTAAQLTSRLFQSFGLVECPELTHEGTIRKYQWHNQHFDWLQEWVDTSDVRYAE